MTTYRTFVRSARDFEEFARARKTTVERGLTHTEARERCRDHNRHRTRAQVAKGDEYGVKRVVTHWNSRRGHG